MDAETSPQSLLQSAETRRPPLGWRDLREWLAQVDGIGELKRIAAPVDPNEEIGAITLLAAREETSPALLFGNMQGDTTGSQILTNMLGASKERYALAVGLDPSLSTREMIEATRSIMADPIGPAMIAKDKAPVNEVVLTGKDIDVTKFPVPKFWPGDGGQFIGTGDITFTARPTPAASMSAAIARCCTGPTASDSIARRESTVCSIAKPGGRAASPARWWRPMASIRYCSCWRRRAFGAEESELDVAGGIMGRPIELTRRNIVKLPIPAHAEFVVEGMLHQGDVLPEGPLGEFTGYYGRERSPQPVMEIKAVHHRKQPIFTHALMARYPSCEIGAYYAIMRSARILDDLERIGVPGVVGAYSHPAAASGWGMVVVSVQQKYAGHSAQVLALAAQCPAAAYYTKWVIVVDEDVDPTDFNDVLWALSTRCHPSEDIDILRNTWSTGLDPSQFPPEARPYGSKVLINACKPHRHLEQFPQSTLLRKSVHDRVVSRWNELGFTGTPRKMTAFHDQ